MFTSFHFNDFCFKIIDYYRCAHVTISIKRYCLNSKRYCSEIFLACVRARYAHYSETEIEK